MTQTPDTVPAAGRRHLEETVAAAAVASWQDDECRRKASAAQHDVSQAWATLIERIAAGDTDLIALWSDYERAVGANLPAIEQARGGFIPYDLAAGHRDRRTLGQALEHAALLAGDRARDETASAAYDAINAEREQVKAAAVAALPADAVQPYARDWYVVTPRPGHVATEQFLARLRADVENLHEVAPGVFACWQGADDGIAYSLAHHPAGLVQRVTEDDARARVAALEEVA